MRFRAELAVLPGGLAHDVVFDVVGGRFAAVSTGVPAAATGTGTDGATRLPGIVLPGFANGHSHAFHRALRGRTDRGLGGPGAPGGAEGTSTFWTWRQAMYAVAARLDPDSHLALARAVYAEMVLAGITAVGEFHYLHHRPGGTPYDDPNAMGAALVQAAGDAGIRLTLLDTCYLRGGLDAHGYAPLDEHQRRFGDRDVDAWAARAGSRAGLLGGAGPGLLGGAGPGLVLGAAIHSVRAVPAEALATVVRAAAGGPLHVHLSEQVAENEACLAFHGVTPTALLDAAGALGPDTTVVHATHLTAADLAALGRRRVHSCLCPTTERELGDGIGPGRALADAGATLGVGSDQHAVVDLFEEARGLESHERLTRHRRGVFGPGELLAAMTDHAALGVPDAGRLEVGARADLVAVRLDTVRTAGIDPAEVLSAATAADVDTVVVDGRTVVSGGHHVLDDGRPGGVAALLAAAIRPLWHRTPREPASWARR